jgi:hypothetical protein
MDVVIPIAEEDMAQTDLLPQAAFRRPVSWFEARGCRFSEDHDDLDIYWYAACRMVRLQASAKTGSFGLAEAQAPLFRDFQAPALRRVGLEDTADLHADIDFVLRHYRGAPDDMVDVLLDRRIALTTEAAVVVRRIASAMRLQEDDIVWPAGDCGK